MARITSPSAPNPDLSYNDQMASSDIDKANVLASHFAQQCSDPYTTDPDHTPSAGAPYPLQDEHPSFVFPPIHSHEILKELQHLSPHKASGCTAISNRVLREAAPVIASSLTHIYNLSLTTATFPSDWKRAIVCPTVILQIFGVVVVDFTNFRCSLNVGKFGGQQFYRI